MREFLERHTDLAIFIILFMEDLGVPMPIPADVLVMYAGYRLREQTLNPFVALPLMLLAVNLAATTLYTIVRRGGRPLVDRFGHYLHLDAHRLARAEHWLEERGALGVFIGRALPGVRLPTVVACGLFKVPLRIFLPAQFFGVSVYLIAFLALGYTFGPQAAEYIRLPTVSLRLVLMLIGAIGLPLVLRQLNRRTAADDTRRIQAGLTVRQQIAAALLAGFAGMLELVAVWGVAVSLTNLMHRAEVRRAALLLADVLNVEARPRAVAIAYTLDYLVVLIACLVAAVIFFQVVMPRLGLRPRRLGPQTLVLWLFMVLLLAGGIGVSLLNHTLRRPRIASLWLSPSAGTIAAIVLLGLIGYAYVAVEMRRLVIDQFSDDPELAPSVMEALSHEPPEPEQDSEAAASPDMMQKPGGIGQPGP